MGMVMHNRILSHYYKATLRAQRLDKKSGFVEEDNSGRSNIFSTGDKALYSYSPTSDKAMRQGIGGVQGLVIASSIAVLVIATTFGIGLNNKYDTASNISLDNLDTLSVIATRLR